jgi:hypothetical protein
VDAVVDAVVDAEMDEGVVNAITDRRCCSG